MTYLCARIFPADLTECVIHVNATSAHAWAPFQSWKRSQAWALLEPFCVLNNFKCLVWWLH